VLIISRYRGRRNSQGWSKPERIGIPVNIVVSVLILLAVFQGEPLATTTMVTTTDDEGRTVEVEVPRQEFRKRIAIFYFENKTGDPSLDWLQYAVPRMLHYDLLQDTYIDLSVGFTDDLQDEGLEAGLGAPLALMRRIAKKNNRAYFTAGSISLQGDQLALTSRLYETGRGEPVAVRTVSGPDVLALVDEMSLHLKHDLDIPVYHIENTADRSLSETLTESPAALREYGLGMQSDARADREAAIEHLEAAVAEDPTFALAQWELFSAYYDLGKTAEMGRALTAAVQHVYKLPTFYQYIVKATYHEQSEDVESALKTTEDWTKIYPQSIDAREMLAAYHEALGDLDGAIEDWKTILDLDPERHNVFRELGDLYARKGEFDQGLEYLEQYRDLYPEDYRSYSAIGSLFSAMGEYEQAKSYYQDARRHAPGEVELTIRIADLEKKLGNFDQARQELLDAVPMVKGPRDRSSLYAALRDWHKTMGQIDKAVEYLEMGAAEEAAFRSPLRSALENTFLRVELYAYTEDYEGALKAIEDLEAVLGEVPLMRFFPKYARIWYYRMAGDRTHIDEAESLLAEIEAIVDKNPTAGLEAMALFADAGVHWLREDYGQAAEIAERAIALFTMLPQDQRVFMRAYILGDMLREAERFPEAEKMILTGLELEPSQPFFHSMLGLTYNDMGRRDEAITHLKRAIEIWKDADPDFKPAVEPREALAELQPGS
jgi:tetratricopeptide (TPR) repeat protein